MPYTQAQEYIHRSFFTNMVDKMVEEVYLRKFFEFYDVSLLGIDKELIDLTNLEPSQQYEQIKSVYYAIISDKDGVYAELSAATGIIDSYNVYEENKTN